MLGVSLLRGRTLDEGDGRGGARVAVVTESFVRRHWPGRARRVAEVDPVSSLRQE